jgi:hypothetical protein
MLTSRVDGMLAAADPGPTPMAELSLRCPSCHHGNPDGSKYCNACGMRVDFRDCPLCDAVNQAAAIRCHKCGTSLTPSTPVEPFAAAASEAAATLMLESPPSVASHVQTGPEPVRRRTPAVRAVVVGVALAALAIPAYVAFHDPEPWRPLRTVPPQAESAVESTATSPPVVEAEAPPHAAAQPNVEPNPTAIPPPPETTTASSVAPAETSVPSPSQKKTSTRQSSKKSSAAGTKQSSTSRKAASSKSAAGGSRAQSSKSDEATSAK